MIPLPPDYGAEILRVEVGSTLHGTGLPGGEDRDEMGVFLEPPNATLGLSPKEHYQFRTAREGERSQPGDTDLIVYSARKWAKLALRGNPSVLLLLFAPPTHIVMMTDAGSELRRNRDMFLGRNAGKAFLGYLSQQRQRITGERGSAGRIRKQADGSPDWKYAMHMLRLGYQGVELLTTANLTLPIQGEPADHLRAVRRGEVPMEEVLAEAERLEERLLRLTEGNEPGALGPAPDREKVEKWLIDAHLDWYQSDTLTP